MQQYFPVTTYSGHYLCQFQRHEIKGYSRILLWYNAGIPEVKYFLFLCFLVNHFLSILQDIFAQVLLVLQKLLVVFWWESRIVFWMFFFFFSRPRHLPQSFFSLLLFIVIIISLITLQENLTMDVVLVRNFSWSLPVRSFFWLWPCFWWSHIPLRKLIMLIAITYIAFVLFNWWCWSGIMSVFYHCHIMTELAITTLRPQEELKKYILLLNFCLLVRSSQSQISPSFPEESVHSVPSVSRGSWKTRSYSSEEKSAVIFFSESKTISLGRN